MPEPAHRVALSVDVEEWYHSRRWVDGRQSTSIPDTGTLFKALYGQDRPIGEVVGPTLRLLDLLDAHGCKATFFILGEIARYYPDLARGIADRGHEIACHGLRHVDASVLGPEGFARELDLAVTLLEKTTGQRPVGYRAPNLVYEPWMTSILESRGFLYDSSVCASRSIGGKYKGWAEAPRHPYHPSYEAIGRAGTARIVELPLPAFPVIKVAAGSGILTRVIGYHWTAVALRHALRTGHTGYYLHPWELGDRPKPQGNRLRNAIFLRRTGTWMCSTVERLVAEHCRRIVPAGAVAREFLERGAATT